MTKFLAIAIFYFIVFNQQGDRRQYRAYISANSLNQAILKLDGQVRSKYEILYLRTDFTTEYEPVLLWKD